MRTSRTVYFLVKMECVQTDICIAGAPIRVPPVPPKAVPMDDQIDPRLVNAMPGQYTYPELSNTLTVEEDQYYRYQNHLLKESRERSAAPSWLKQVQQAAMTTLPEQASYQDRSWDSDNLRTSHSHLLNSSCVDFQIRLELQGPLTKQTFMAIQPRRDIPP
jgi:hypothetical protein